MNPPPRIDRQRAKPLSNRATSVIPDPIAKTLQSLFVALGPALLDHGVTPHQIYDLLKKTIVSAASSRSLMASGKVNRSKVAALTGLTRAEVRTLLKARPAPSPTPRIGLDRATRVLEGWLTDPQFITRSGRPRVLKLNVPKGGFEELVRRHSGDIPPRVVLDQLTRRGHAQVSGHSVKLVSTEQPRNERTFHALPDVAPYVSDLLAAATSDHTRLTFAHRLELFPENDLGSQFLSDRAARTLATAISALSSSVRKDAPHSFHTKIVVSVAVTAHKSQENQGGS